MSIRLALSSTSFPQWPLSRIIQEAGAMGYQGIDLITRFGPNTPEFPGDAQQGDASAIKDALAKANIQPVCLTTNISFATASEDDGQAAIAKARHAADRAAAIGAPAIRVLAYDAPRGRHPHNVMANVARLVLEAADYAGQQGVQVLFENLGSFKTARDWWWCMELIRHPMVGMCWNPASALSENELPAISVPMLNSRIRMVRLSDCKQDSPMTAVPLGQGDLPVPKLLHRLMGVGYQGWVVVDWDRMAHPELEDASTILPAASEQMTTWLTEANKVVEPKKVVRKAAPAAKPVGKPAVAKATAAPASKGTAVATEEEEKPGGDESSSEPSASA